MLKVGVLGAGHLGKIHLRLLNQSQKYELTGFYDPNSANADKVAAEFGYKSRRIEAPRLEIASTVVGR